jgi:hypothetical protein
LETPALYRATLASGALGLAALLLAPGAARAWSFLGGSLALDQRDLRVFNNFSDPEANSNAQPDPDYPGAVGAPLAIWKAAVEWGSTRHGTGLGDPSNSDGLGSGGADFDFCWQGETSGVGGTNDNIVSELAGSSGGVFAFCELPISDGWRIRFYSDAAIWHDGPGQIPSTAGHKDVQGIATHELGHALGLDHSNVPDATMLGSVIGNGVLMRSIAADDQGGVQALYGAASAGKPTITALFVPDATTLVVAGTNFAASGNEVWFTDGNAGANGAPLVLAGLAADPTGTRIACSPPAGAAAGDVLVHVPGTSGATLSNAFPYEPGQPSCPPIQTYGTPKPTSIGTLPALYWTGRASATTNDLVIGTAGGVPGSACVLFCGQQSASTPFQGGTLYVGGPLRRYAARTLDFVGGVEYSIPITPALVGTRRYFQLWFADAGDAFGVGLSDGLQLYFCP